MKAFYVLALLSLSLVSCVRKYNYCPCETTDEKLGAYNDIINELVEKRFYNFYLGKDEERIFKAYVEIPEDSIWIRNETIRLQNEIYGDTSRLCTLYLDTKLLPYFQNLKYYETDTEEYSERLLNVLSDISDNKQAIIDSLNERQIKYSSANFHPCTFRMVDLKDAHNSSSKCEIGKISLSKLFLNNEKNKGVLYYEFECGEQCGKGELIVIELLNGRWHISKSLRLWIS